MPFARQGTFKAALAREGQAKALILERERNIVFTFARLVNVVAAIAAAATAFFWFWASIVPVPENIDTFIGALQWIGRLNAYGATCGGIGAVCGLIMLCCGRQQQPR